MTQRESLVRLIGWPGQPSPAAPTHQRLSVAVSDGASLSIDILDSISRELDVQKGDDFGLVIEAAV